MSTEIQPTGKATIKSFDWHGTSTVIVPLLVVLGLIVALYLDAIYWWQFEWTREGSYYAHGIFIPVFVGLMIWRDRERLRRLPVSRNYGGLALVVVAILLVMFALRVQVTTSLSISFVIFLIGATLFLAGKPIAKALLFPLLFLFTMIPIVPDQLINPVAFPIQIVSAKMAAAFCNVIGFPAIRTGTHIQMEHYLLNVELPCSGFKTLVGLLAFAAAFAYLVEGEKWKRWILFVSAAPLAIIVNGVRITFIALVGESFGDNAAAKFHDWSGFIVLILGFTVLFNLSRLLKCDRFLGMPLRDPDVKVSTGESSESSVDQAETVDAVDQQHALDERYGPPRKGALKQVSRSLYPLIALLILAVVAKANIRPQQVNVMPVGPNDVPLTLGDWKRSGDDIPIDAITKAATNPRTWIDRYYVKTGSDSGRINLLLSSGSGRRVFHDPHTCFLGSGYYLHDRDVETIQTSLGPVQAAVAEVEDPDHNRSLMMYVYVVGGKQLQNTQGVNWALMVQAIAGDAGKPSYFLRFRHMSTGVGADRLDELKKFVADFWTSVGQRVTQ